MAHVAILGGGFGGLAAAHELRDLLDDEHRITLVDRSERFFMGFAKLWDLAGMRPLEEGTVGLERLEHRGVRFLRADVTRIDPEARVVETSAGTVEADAIVVALGAGPAPHHVELLRGPGAHDLYAADQLPGMREDLDTIAEGRVLVAILGGPFKCPPAPYEAALLVDERLRRRGVRDRVEVALATPQPITLPAAGVDASGYVAQHLEGRGIELLTRRVVTTTVPDRRLVHFEDGTEMDYTVLLGVPADVPPDVVRDSPLAGPGGWVHPDRHTLRTEFDGVYAIGDCTTIPTATAQLPKAGVFAAGEGAVAARNIAADLTGGEPARFDGHGYCFLELPGEQVAFVEGDFFAEPEPDVALTPADHEQFLRKQAFERDRLAAWLG